MAIPTEKTINSIDDLLDFITALHIQKAVEQKSNDEKTGKNIENEKYIPQIHTLWFRGMANKSWELLPSIQRSPERIANERFITNDFYIKAKQVMEHSPDKKNYAAWMSIMQHYGLPTRLLDWSSSPLVATFFAVEYNEKERNADACIWVLDPVKLNRYEKFGGCIYPVDADTAQHMLLPAFKGHGHHDDLKDKILACHSTENNLRMYSQQANFTIHNTNKMLTQLDYPGLLYKIIIPAELKNKFLYDLAIFGITESFIYPDLDHISNDLKVSHNI